MNNYAMKKQKFVKMMFNEQLCNFKKKKERNFDRMMFNEQFLIFQSKNCQWI